MPAKKQPAKRVAAAKKPAKPIEHVAPMVWVVDGERYFTLEDAEKAAGG